MKKATVFILVIFFINQEYSFSDEMLPTDIKYFLENYRNAKSLAVATTGDKVTKEIREKYWHEVFYVIANDENKTIYILSDDFEINSVKFKQAVDVEYRDRMDTLLKTAKEDNYDLIITEKIIGTIKDSRVNYIIPSNFLPNGYRQMHYNIYITAEGPKVESESTFLFYFILQKDVPLLMDRIGYGGFGKYDENNAGQIMLSEDLLGMGKEEAKKLATVMAHEGTHAAGIQMSAHSE
jgi:hypothetical protein